MSEFVEISEVALSISMPETSNAAVESEECFPYIPSINWHLD